MQATRFFRDEPVPTAVLDEVLGAARWCGSARNRQPWVLFVTTSPVIRQRLAALAPHGAHLATAPVNIVLGLDHDHGGRDTELDGGRLVQTILRACEDRGLGSCPVTFFPDTAVAAAAEIVGAGPALHTRTAIAIGYPDQAPSGTPAIPVGRRSHDDVVRWL